MNKKTRRETEPQATQQTRTMNARVVDLEQSFKDLYNRSRLSFKSLTDTITLQQQEIGALNRQIRELQAQIHG